jgi:uncharacterized protein (TIGR03067 family)
LVAGAASQTDGSDEKEASEKGDLEKIQGTWNIVAVEHDGKKEKLKFKSYRWTFRGSKVTTFWVRDDDTTGGGGATPFTLDPAKEPRELTISDPGVTIRAIYKLEKDTLTISYFGKPEKERPRSFKAAEAGDGGLPVMVWVLKRAKDEDGKTQTLLDAVKEFNQRARWNETEPALTEDEVVAAIRGWNREQHPATDKVYKTYQTIADTKKLPAEATLTYTTKCTGNRLEFDVWWVDLNIKTGVDSGYTFRIRDRKLRCRPLEP